MFQPAAGDERIVAHSAPGTIYLELAPVRWVLEHE